MPRQTARTVCAERVAAVEFGTHLVEAADDDARRLGGKVRRVVGAREADDGDAGNALECFSNRLVGDGADILRRDRIDDGVGVAFAVLRRFLGRSAERRVATECRSTCHPRWARENYTKTQQ